MLVVADMHCHILPGLDDGAKSREMMEQMLRMSYDSGVRAMIATSHYNPRSFKYSLPEYEQRLMLAAMNAMDIDAPVQDLFRPGNFFCKWHHR